MPDYKEKHFAQISYKQVLLYHLFIYIDQEFYKLLQNIISKFIPKINYCNIVLKMKYLCNFTIICHVYGVHYDLFVLFTIICPLLHKNINIKLTET